MHHKTPQHPVMPQSNLFCCSSREETGIVMAALCLWKFHSGGGHVSVCLTWFRIVGWVYIWILLRLFLWASQLISVAMIWQEEVSELHHAHLDHVISVFRFQALWKSLQKNRYNVLVVRSFNSVQNSAVYCKPFHEVIVILMVSSLENN